VYVGGIRTHNVYVYVRISVLLRSVCG